MTPNTPIPDYGEPWREQTVSFIPGTIEDRDGNVVNALKQKLRAIACVNACAGMADPEKEITAMREEIAAADTSSESELIQETQSQSVTLITQNERLLKERQAMLEAIREAVTAINRLTAATTGDMQYAKAKQDAIRFGNATLTKLQPYIKP